MRFPLALALLTAFAACRSSSPDGPAAPDGTIVTRVTAPDTLRLHVGESGSVDGGRLVVQFRGVEGDSRCPSTVVCVWQGDAAALLRLTADGRRAGTTLHTALQPRAIEYAGYDVALTRVEPHPDGRTPIDSSAYVAVISVTRR